MSKYGSFLGGVLGSLFKEPATSAYPFKKREFPERTRGSIAIDIDACIFCGACEKRCPSSAIKVDRKTKTWSIDRMGCVQCENCVNGCPKKCLSTDNQYTAPATTKTVDTFKQETAEEAHQATALPKADLEACVYCTLCAKNCPQNALDVDRAAKKWKLDDTKCVSCGLCAEKCPKKCIDMVSAEDAAPKIELAPYDILDLPKADLDDCVYCGLCSTVCPQGAISMDKDSGEWMVDEDKCIHCGICYYKCPKKCIKMTDRETALKKPAPKKAAAAEVSLPKADLESCVYCTLCAKNCPQNALEVDRAAKKWTLDADKCVSCGLCAEKCPKKCIEMSSDAPEKVPAFMSGYNVDAMPDADLEACVFCGLCQRSCPQGALSVDRENKTWTIDKEKCIQCGICAYKCPKKCIEMK